MAYKTSILLGRITKVSGYEGAVTIKLEKGFLENIPHMESVFLEIEGRPVPFFISGSEYSGADILKLKFEDYGSIEKIGEFTGSRVFLTVPVHETDSEEDLPDITGYKILINDDELLGTVKDVIQNQSQWLINIESIQGKDILIPFHEDLIAGIDEKRKTINMDLPEGLTDLN